MAQRVRPTGTEFAHGPVDLRWLRREFIRAIAEDDYLHRELVLKGGNALDLVHGIGGRASLDLDYSMRGDAEDQELLSRRILAALGTRLSTHGLRLFDGKFQRRPSTDSEERGPKWGGYTVEFKVIQEHKAKALLDEMNAMRREALSVTGHPQAERRFRVELSTYEHCDPIEDVPLEGGYVCRVYTPELIAAEKLRSLCQQMDEYPMRSHPTPRARDFYDLHAVITSRGVELSEESMHELIEIVFAAKDVPTSLLGQLRTYRDFHEEDWPSVRDSIPADKVPDFDYYFAFVLSEIRKLEPLWYVDLP
ncbi:MAG: nucleotidyl transferase AbiEii/AbiGii toxin family protein [Planctomycetota bacterium]